MSSRAAKLPLVGDRDFYHVLGLVVSRTGAASPTPRETEEEHNSRARHCTEKNLEELEGH